MQDADAISIEENSPLYTPECSTLVFSALNEDAVIIKLVPS
jgi:hypothetical protein